MCSNQKELVYTYDGLYQVTAADMEVGQEGFKICKSVLLSKPALVPHPCSVAMACGTLWNIQYVYSAFRCAIIARQGLPGVACLQSSAALVALIASAACLTAACWLCCVTAALLQSSSAKLIHLTRWARLVVCQRERAV